MSSFEEFLLDKKLLLIRVIPLTLLMLVALYSIIFHNSIPDGINTLLLLASIYTLVVNNEFQKKYNEYIDYGKGD